MYFHIPILDTLNKLAKTINLLNPCRLFSAAATRRGFVPRQIPVRRKWGEKNWQFRFKFDQPLRLCRVSKQDLWNSRKKSDASAGWRKIIVIICFSIIYIFSFQWKVKFHHWQPWCYSFSRHRQSQSWDPDPSTIFFHPASFKKKMIWPIATQHVSTANSNCSDCKSCLRKWSVDKVHKLPHTFVMCNVYYEKEVRHHYRTGSTSNNHSQASILHWSQIQFLHFSFPSSAFTTLNWVHNQWFAQG